MPAQTSILEFQIPNCEFRIAGLLDLNAGSRDVGHRRDLQRERARRGVRARASPTTDRQRPGNFQRMADVKGQFTLIAIKTVDRGFVAAIVGEDEGA